MKKNYLLLIVCSLCICFLACDEPEEEFDEDAFRSDIQAMEDRYAQYQNERQADSLAFYYAEDVVSYSPDEAPISGRDALIADIKKDMAEDTTDGTVRFEVIDVFADGDLAVEVGSVNVSEAGKGEQERGHYMVVLERRDGEWVVVREMYNDRQDWDAEGEVMDEDNM